MTFNQQGVGQPDEKFEVKLAAKVGAGLFVLWGILHLWVGFEGLH